MKKIIFILLTITTVCIAQDSTKTNGHLIFKNNTGRYQMEITNMVRSRVVVRDSLQRDVLIVRNDSLFVIDSSAAIRAMLKGFGIKVKN
jgi:hypothetical protein